MLIVASYCVDKGFYYSPDNKHYVEMTTTEYTYKKDVLAHLIIGKNLGIRLDNMLAYEFGKSGIFHNENEQFFHKKTYSHDKIKKTTRGTFEDRLKQFDMSQTVIEHEIVEEYAYIDKNGVRDSVQIVITEKADIMTASIDFKSVEQHNNFTCPVWLTKPC